MAKNKQKNVSTKLQNSKKKMVSVVEEEPHPEDSVIFLQPAKLYESDYSSGDDSTVAVIENAVEKVACPSRLAILTLLYSWTTGVHSAFSIVHSHRKWYKAVLDQRNGDSTTWDIFE